MKNSEALEVIGSDLPDVAITGLSYDAATADHRHITSLEELRQVLTTDQISLLKQIPENRLDLSMFERTGQVSVAGVFEDDYTPILSTDEIEYAGRRRKGMNPMEEYIASSTIKSLYDAGKNYKIDETEKYGFAFYTSVVPGILHLLRALSSNNQIDIRDFPGLNDKQLLQFNEENTLIVPKNFPLDDPNIQAFLRAKNSVQPNDASQNPSKGYQNHLVKMMTFGLPNGPYAKIARDRGYGGTLLGLSAACATGGANISSAFKELTHPLSRLDYVVAGALSISEIPQIYQAFVESKVLKSQENAQYGPFDERSDGLIPGEIAGSVVLESIRDQDSSEEIAAYGYVLSSSTAFDIEMVKASLQQPAMIEEVMYRFQPLIEAGIMNQDNFVVLPHATGTEEGDKNDIEVLTEAVERGYIPCNAHLELIKGAVLHKFDGSMLDSLYTAFLNFQHDELYAAQGLENPRYDEQKFPLRVVRDFKQDQNIEFALIGGVGLGGVTSWMLVSKRPLAHYLAEAA